MLVASIQMLFVELWELDENETLTVNKFCKQEHNGTVLLCLSSGTHTVRGREDFCIKAWDLAQLMALNSYPAYSGHIICVAASPKGLCISSMQGGQ